MPSILPAWRFWFCRGLGPVGGQEFCWRTACGVSVFALGMSTAGETPTEARRPANRRQGCGREHEAVLAGQGLGSWVRRSNPSLQATGCTAWLPHRGSRASKGSTRHDGLSMTTIGEASSACQAEAVSAIAGYTGPADRGAICVWMQGKSLPAQAGLNPDEILPRKVDLKSSASMELRLSSEDSVLPVISSEER